MIYYHFIILLEQIFECWFFWFFFVIQMNKAETQLQSFTCSMGKIKLPLIWIDFGISTIHQYSAEKCYFAFRIHLTGPDSKYSLASCSMLLKGFLIFDKTVLFGANLILGECNPWNSVIWINSCLGVGCSIEAMGPAQLHLEAWRLSDHSRGVCGQMLTDMVESWCDILIDHWTSQVCLNIET